ncbi:AAEL005620-PA [Aedes aegypti]|uniref:AAEL005620-PA n=1 Tax=Aedes aegypti TaxID=7159 RepID=Q179H1_AEDAE|nr:AAEL005620-PA [Aedes aegypti]
MAFGDHPAEYNPKIHGPYDPVRYYGKPDTPLTQVKLIELGAWFGHRDKNPRLPLEPCLLEMHKYWKPKRMGIAPFFQAIVGGMVFFYAINCGKRKHHRNY